MKKLLSVLLCVSLLLSLGLCQAEGTDLSLVQGKGVLLVGITDFAPMDYRDENGEWIGFDAELARAFAASIGVEVEFVEIDWDTKQLELDSGSIDCVWNGMTLTPEVLSSMECSNAYAQNAQVVVLPASKAADYPDAESMKALSFAVEAGSAGEQGFAKNAVSSQAAALMEVAALTSDAAIIDLQMANAMVGEGTSYADLCWSVALNSEEYGVGFRKGSDIAAMLNQFLADAYADGSLLELAAKYGMDGTIIPQ